MKKTSITLAVLTFFVGSTLLAQDMEIPQIPAGSVVRTVNCTISSDRTDFNDIVAVARDLEFGENAPDRVQFRNLIYGTPDYNFDFQIGMYYPSVSEMIRRRVADGNNGYGRLGIECGNAAVINNAVVYPGDGLNDDSLMATTFCSVNEGWSMRGAFNVLQAGAANVARDSGNNTMVQFWTQLLGGPINPPWDFMLVQVGTDYQELAERQDVFREGYRPVAGENRGGIGRTCSRWGLWRTVTIHANN